MESGRAFASLHGALDRLERQGRTADFWLRDDDAVEPGAALDRLLDLTADNNVPLALAVIPAASGASLARRLEVASQVTVAVHGWAHINHAPPSEKKQELGRHRAPALVLAELANGLSRLRALHGERLLAMLVPPWNRIDPDLVYGLGGLGFRLLSTFGPPKPCPLGVLNSTVDLIDWHGTRSCRDPSALVDDIVAQLEPGGQPVGLLTHHLVHDEACWQFLHELFSLTANHPAARWRSAAELATSGG